MIHIYRLVGVIALILCWKENLNYISLGVLSGIESFIDDTWANAASRSITIDIVFVFISASIFMIRESRRHKIRHVWLYLLGSVFLALSFAFPFFLAARERALRSKGIF
jgi:hypothetical protein